MGGAQEPGEQAEVWVWPDGDRSRWGRLAAQARPFWLPLTLMSLALGLMIWEASAGAGAFWQKHPLATNLATELLMAVILIFGLERLMARRSRRQWRPIGLMIAHELEFGYDVDEMIEARFLDHCDRRWGQIEIPQGVPYETVVMSALMDPRTWEGDEEIPPLLEEIEKAKESLDEAMRRWGPIMIAEPELAVVAAAVPPVLDQLRGFVVFMGLLHPSQVRGTQTKNGLPLAYAASCIVEALDDYAQAHLELDSRIVAYRTGERIRRLTGKEAREWDARRYEELEARRKAANRAEKQEAGLDGSYPSTA
jgi:hypothetical protein